MSEGDHIENQNRANVYDMFKLPDGWQRYIDLRNEYVESEEFKSRIEDRRGWIDDFFASHPEVDRTEEYAQDSTHEDLVRLVVRSLTLIEVAEEKLGNFDFPHLWQPGKTTLDEQVGNSLEDIIDNFKKGNFMDVNRQLQEAVRYIDVNVFGSKHNINPKNFPVLVIRDAAFSLASHCRNLNYAIEGE